MNDSVDGWLGVTFGLSDDSIDRCLLGWMDDMMNDGFMDRWARWIEDWLVERLDGLTADYMS